MLTPADNSLPSIQTETTLGCRMPLPPSSGPTRPPPPRLLSSPDGGRAGASNPWAGVKTRSGNQAQEDEPTFTATLPFSRPKSSAARTQGPSQPQGLRGTPLPRWAKGLVIGGVLLALAMPATVLMSRSMLVQEALAQESASKAVLHCTAGEGRALDDSNPIAWLFSGSYFSCGDWETRDARVQRDRDQAQANYMARERARQGY